MMKKGLLLSLLVVAVVVMTVPAGARAPIVMPLPDIIIGDLGSSGDPDDIDGANHLLRYLNITQIGAPGWITTQNGMGTANLSVYYACFSDGNDPDGSVLTKASTDVAIVEPLTEFERTVLTGASHVMPAPGKMINAGGFSWLSLINTAAVSSGTLTDAYSATPLLNGQPPAAFPAGWDAISSLTIYAVEEVSDGVDMVRLVGQASSAVWSELGVVDSSGAAPNVLVDLDFAGNLRGWVPMTITDTADFLGGFALPLPEGLGFLDTPADNALPIYGEWQSGLDDGNPEIAPIIDADEATVGANNILRMTATLGTNAATAAEATAYRIQYAADAFQHLGAVWGLTVDPATAGPVPGPATGANFDLVALWAVPYTLTEYADGELLSDLGSVVAGFEDARDYKVIFGMIDGEAADVDPIWLANLLVEVIARPLGKVPHIAWGTGVPFDDPTQGWQESIKQPVIGGVLWGRGDVVYGPSGAWLDIAPGFSSPAYQESAPRPNGFGVAVSDAAGKVVRFRTSLVSITNVDQTPMIRMIALAWRGAGVSNMVWQEELGSTMFLKGLLTGAGVTSGAPATPKSTGSVIETYYHTQNGDGTSLLAPTMDIYNPGTLDGTTWPNVNGAIRVSFFSVEDDV